MKEIQKNSPEVGDERSRGNPFDGMSHRKALNILIGRGYLVSTDELFDSSFTHEKKEPARLLPENYVFPDKEMKKDDIKSAIILQLVEVYRHHEHVRGSLDRFKINKRKPETIVEADDSVIDKPEYRVPSFAQQKKLFDDINRGYSVYITMERGGDLPTAEQEVAFVKLVAAYTIMMQCNFGLVVDIAKSKPEYHYTHGKNLTRRDIIQYGFIGLSRAIVKFDVSLGWRFSTYAHHWIDQSISRNIADFGKDIRIPVNVLQEVYVVRGYIDRTYRETGHTATLAEVSEKTGFSIEKIKYLLRVSESTTSLNRELRGSEDSEGNELGDFIVDDAPSPDALLYQNESVSVIDGIMGNGTLSPEEKMVLRIRFRLEKHLQPGEAAVEQSLTSIAKYMGLTKIDVRRIERRGLTKLVRKV